MAVLIQFAVLLNTDEQELIDSFVLRAKSELWRINRTSFDERGLTAEEVSEVVGIYGPSISYALDFTVPEFQVPDTP